MTDSVSFTEKVSWLICNNVTVTVTVLAAKPDNQERGLPWLEGGGGVGRDQRNNFHPPPGNVHSLAQRGGVVGTGESKQTTWIGALWCDDNCWENIVLVLFYYSWRQMANFSESDIREAFQTFDRDGNGFIGASDIHNTYLAMNENLNDDEVI